MSGFSTMRLAADPDAVAPDGSDVRLLLRLSGGGMAHFQLASGETSTPMMHRTIEEIWYFIGGEGEMWRRSDSSEETIALEADVCITIPLGTCFQFRSTGTEPLAAIAVTMPSWPGEGEAHAVDGPWTPTVPK